MHLHLFQLLHMIFFSKDDNIPAKEVYIAIASIIPVAIYTIPTISGFIVFSSFFAFSRSIFAFSPTQLKSPTSYFCPLSYLLKSLINIFKLDNTTILQQ